MKKNIKIVLTNILLIICFLFVIDFCIWGYQNFLMYKNKEKYIGVWPIKYHTGVKNFDIDLKYFPNPNDNWGREAEGTKYKKKPIALFGCSYAYGHGLNKEQTLSYKLSKKTKRPVYNRAVSAWGVQHMLYQAHQPLLYEQVPEPEYVVFLMMYDHIRRIYTRSFSSGHLLNEERYLRYKEFDNQLVQKKGIKVNSPISYIRNIIDRSYITSLLYETYVNYYLINPQNYKKYSNFIIKHFVQSKNEMQAHWANTKFVVLMYDKLYNEKNFAEELQKNGFEVINLNTITNTNLNQKEYKLEHDPHPNEEAWEIISESLKKELKL